MRADARRCQRNDLWDVIAELWHPDGVPQSQRTNVGRAVNEFLDVQATPEEVRQRFKRARDAWDKPFTPFALVKHWQAFHAERDPDLTLIDSMFARKPAITQEQLAELSRD